MCADSRRVLWRVGLASVSAKRPVYKLKTYIPVCSNLVLSQAARSLVFTIAAFGGASNALAGSGVDADNNNTAP
jgi:hypothetical protein